MPDAPILLDREETSVSDPRTQTYQRYLTIKNPNEWSATEDLYHDLKWQGEANHIHDLYYCRTSAFFVRHIETGQVRIRSNACHLRWCPLCSASKSAYQKKAVMAWACSRSGLKLMTLTLKHSPAVLTHQIKNLYRCFALFRKDKTIKSLIRGAVWFIQIKLSTRDNQWHPHVHMIIDSDYIPHTDLVRIWRRITITSKIVDIRAIWNPKFAASYVGRYAARPAALTLLRRAERVELALALRGRRLAGTWGSARVVKLTKPKRDDRADWLPLGTWDEIYGVKSTDPVAASIFEAWRNGEPYSGDPADKNLEVLWFPPKKQPYQVSENLWLTPLDA